MRTILGRSPRFVGHARVGAGMVAIGMLLPAGFVQRASQPPSHSTPITNAAGADFVATTALQPTISSAVWQVTNSIENRSDRPLSVDWKGGGVTCIGSAQIRPHGKQDGTNPVNQLINPAVMDSDVKYGARLQYSGVVGLFVQTKLPLAGSLESSFSQRSAEGGITKRFAVTSGLAGDGKTSTLSIEAPEKMIIAIPVALGALLRDDPQVAASGWRALGTFDATQVALSDGTFASVARERLGTNVVLLTTTSGAPKLSAKLTGSGWSAQRLILAAFDADHTGLVAFAVSVFVPGGRGGVTP